ncbi:hypothetical protein E0H82_00200 [Acinetobacter sp. ANC 4910]|uniref:hypothetical protein n=1 Tax=Acinetobacter sp. ANC 4910 TaxID=2529850 RepID=UPI00103BBCA2|nr:hypothetical protein [Acinetobacter sp. ANC 4910]TCB38059.1 hypothetical protein E0H82_00200 [Acinetobacter sp. ANC 4910]
MIKNIVLLVLTVSLLTGCLWHDDWDHRHNRPSPHHDSDHRPDSNQNDYSYNQHNDHNQPPQR